MKTYPVNQTFSPAAMSEALIAAGINVITVQGFGISELTGLATTGTVYTDDAAVDATVNATIAAGTSGQVTSDERSIAVKLATDPSAQCKLQRAIILGILDSAFSALNTLREWDVSFQAAVAAATSLANLQTRVAALPSLGDLVESNVIATVKAAIISHINNGDAD